jgi:pimeloyl-ACP methyl ester carboxylesterase
MFLGDYISLRDDVTIDDVTKRMEEVVAERLALPDDAEGKLGPRFHLVVHSTGGLVARRWIARYYDGRLCPVVNLLMLAPANFGSVLAHKGRSLLGRVVKGWRTGFETGEEMLYALELGSPFLWDLARADLFDEPGRAARQPLYGPERIRPFVIVGTHPYDKLATQLTNENGSDGTVRVAAANLNAYALTVDFSAGEDGLKNPRITPWPARLEPDVSFPLAVLPDRDHGSITRPDEEGYAKDPEAQARLGELILQALRTGTPDEYRAVTAAWDAVTAETRTFAGASDDARAHRDGFFKKKDVERQYFHEHYQVFVRAVDEFGAPVADYFVAFMPQKERGGIFSLRSSLPSESVFFHREVLADVHKHRRDPANICMFMDRYDLMREGGFYDRVPGSKLVELAFTVTAEDPGDRISYFSRRRDARHGLVRLHDRESQENRWLRRHSTHLVELIVPRVGVPTTFSLRGA